MLVSSINEVLSRGKDFEQLRDSFDPAYDDMLTAVELVKQFITENKLIIYGGTGLDMALRLRGDKIYPDDLFPDLDFYSSNNIEHAYTLADILYNRGYKDARVVRGMHIHTMRIDLVDNHFIADISYQPPEIFDLMPFLEYNGMRIIHPTFQRIDMHSALSFPYDGAPREVIFARWSKDISRFNKLDEHYPIKAPSGGLPWGKMTIPRMQKYVFGGFIAYSFIFAEFKRLMNDRKLPADVISSHLDVTSDNITFDTIDQKLEIMHIKIEKASDELGLGQVHVYEPIGSIIPGRIEGVAPFGNVTILSTENKMLSINSVKIAGESFRVVNIQYLLKQFLASHFLSKKTPKLSNTYLLLYLSLVAMIKHIEAVITIEEAVDSILFPSIETYGSDNIDLAKEILLNNLYVDLDKVPAYATPWNYYPARSVPKGFAHPSFNLEDSKFFRERGREIVDK